MSGQEQMSTDVLFADLVQLLRENGEQVRRGKDVEQAAVAARERRRRVDKYHALEQLWCEGCTSQSKAASE